MINDTHLKLLKMKHSATLIKTAKLTKICKLITEPHTVNIYSSNLFHTKYINILCSVPKIKNLTAKTFHICADSTQRIIEKVCENFQH